MLWPVDGDNGEIMGHLGSLASIRSIMVLWSAKIMCDYYYINVYLHGIPSYGIILMML